MIVPVYINLKGFGAGVSLRILSVLFPVLFLPCDLEGISNLLLVLDKYISLQYSGCLLDHFYVTVVRKQVSCLE